MLRLLGLADNPVYMYGMPKQRRWWMLAWSGLLIVFSIVIALIGMRHPEKATWIYCGGTLGLGALLATCFIPAIVPPLLTREYERRTYEQLRLTRMTEGQIVWGKTAVVVVPIAAGLATTIPISIIAMAVLDIPPGLLLASYTGSIVLVTAATMLGLWMATRQQSVFKAVFMSYLVWMYAMPVGLLLSWGCVVGVYCAVQHVAPSSRVYVSAGIIAPNIAGSIMAAACATGAVRTLRLD